MPEGRFATVEMTAPVMAHWIICSCDDLYDVSANATPICALATALFFCDKTQPKRH